MAASQSSVSRPRPMSILLLSVVVIACLAGLTNGQANSYGQYSFGANNYFGLGGSYMNNGLWWVQRHCPWGSHGYRAASQYQCGTFSCPSLWFGSNSYQCPPPTLYSNTLQRCVLPATLATGCHT